MEDNSINTQHGSASFITVLFLSFLLSLGGIGSATALALSPPSEFMAQFQAFVRAAAHAETEDIASLPTVTPSPFETSTEEETPTTTPTPTQQTLKSQEELHKREEAKNHESEEGEHDDVDRR